LAGGWQYGFGEMDPQTKRLKSFARLTHGTGQQWQAGEKVPDDQHGWVLLNAAGGHPGNDHAHAVVRRWIAPFGGVVVIRGKLTHPR
jgi:hypothetical protein